MATTEHMVEQHTIRQPTQPRPTSRLKVAYIMSRFPKLSETFVLYEMLALQQQGVAVEVFPLINERASVMHPEARQFVEDLRARGYTALTGCHLHVEKKQ